MLAIFHVVGSAEKVNVLSFALALRFDTDLLFFHLFLEFPNFLSTTRGIGRESFFWTLVYGSSEFLTLKINFSSCYPYSSGRVLLL